MKKNVNRLVFFVTPFTSEEIPDFNPIKDAPAGEEAKFAQNIFEVPLYLTRSGGGVTF